MEGILRLIRFVSVSLVILVAGVFVTSAVVAEEEPVEEVQVELMLEDSDQMEEIPAVDEEIDMGEYPVLEEPYTE